MKYELWKDEDEGCTGYSMFPETHSPEQKQAMKGADDAVLLVIFDAPDWDDARRQMNEYLDFEPYVPMED